MRCFKAYSTEPSYGTYQTTRQFSRIARENRFPYPFYFVSNPFSDEPTVNPRRAGWSSEIVPVPAPYKPDPYPDHCFQMPCNTVVAQERPPPPPPTASAVATPRAGKGAGSGAVGAVPSAGGMGTGCVPIKTLTMDR